MTKSTITRQQLEEWVAQFEEDGGCDATDRQLEALIRQSLSAMDSSESVELPLDYLQGHKDGLEWAARLAEANHPDTGDWLYDDPIELAKAIRKGPDMPLAQPVADSEPVAYISKSDFDAGYPHILARRDFNKACTLPVYAAQPATEYPEVLPCPVLLEPGMRFGKGVKTRLVLDAIQRRAEQYAELEAMTQEERAEYDANIEAFKAMLPQPVPVAYSDFESFWSSYIHPLAQDDELKGFAWDIWCAAMLQAGSSPVIPEGSASMLRRWLAFGRGMKNAGSQLPRNLIAETESMLAAATQPQNAPQNITEIIPGWIPVSERMPEVGDIVLTAMGGVVNVGETECSAANCRFFTSVISGRELPATHRMQLPAAPQEVGDA
ncbi:TPA: DUF551 domain-containing protein [Klebsiella quasipneumoniae]